MTYHDLRSPEIRAESPIELGCLLGLGLKFCIQEERPKELVLNETFERLNRDVRLKYKFAGKESEQCDKKIFVKSTWQPKAASLDTENILKAFEDNIRQERDISRARPRATNLSKHQFNILNHLRSNKDIIIIQCDKNLGPGVMQRETYIREMLRQHLQDGKGTYRQISKDYSREVMRKVKENMREIIRGRLSDTEHKYFSRKFQADTIRARDCLFYGMAKVHKNTFPVPLRPVVSQCGTLSAIASIFIDYKLQPLKYEVASYIKDSYHLILKLLKLGRLPRHCWLFTSDATSMYTNIDPVEGIETIRKYLKYFAPGFASIECGIILDLLKLVMENCVFKFGETFWLQLIGTAMGTPVACIYAILFFAYYERTILLRKYKKNLLLYVRQIDDIFGIWIENKDNPNAWEDFQQDLNSACKLEWTTTPLSKSVDFLDITIMLDKKGNISTKTFQKKMNLFLYIPPHSSHPPGLMKSLIYGLLLTYFLQNTLRSDFFDMISLLYNRLLARGHISEDIYPIFMEATQKIEDRYDPMVDSQKNTDKSDPSCSDEVLFFHIPYHTRDISRQKIRDIYEKTCEGEPQGFNFKHIPNEDTDEIMKIPQLTIAYSRPKKLRDLLCPSKMIETEKVFVSKYV